MEATRTVRQSAERVAAAAAAASTAAAGVATGPTGSANTGLRMNRPEPTHRLAADRHQSPTENSDDDVQPPDVETEPEIDRLSSDGAETRCRESATDSFHDGVSASASHPGDTEERRQPRPETTSSTTARPEVVSRHPIAARNRKSTCQEPITERFDRVVRYFDSRQHVTGKSCRCPNSKYVDEFRRE